VQQHTVAAGSNGAVLEAATARCEKLQHVGFILSLLSKETEHLLTGQNQSIPIYL